MSTLGALVAGGLPIVEPTLIAVRPTTPVADRLGRDSKIPTHLGIRGLLIQPVELDRLALHFLGVDLPHHVLRSIETSVATSRLSATPGRSKGQRTGALNRPGDPRAMALAGALCVSLFAVTGFTNGSLRALVARLLGAGYTTRQMSYDLRRLRLHGLIHRMEGRHRHVLTDDGRKFAVFYTKLGDRVIGPLFDTDRPNAPPRLVRALDTIDTCLNDSFTDAGLARAT